MIRALNSIWWNKQISPKDDERLGRTMVVSVFTWESEVWTDLRKKFYVLQLDYIRRNGKISRRNHTTNDEKINRIRKMNVHQNITYRIEKRGSRWSGHVCTISQRWLRSKVFEWKLKCRLPEIDWLQGTKQCY